MKIVYDSENRKVDLMLNDIEKSTKSQLHFAHNFGKIYVPSDPLANSFITILKQYLYDTCDNVPEMIDRGKAIIDEITIKLNRLIINDRNFGLSFYRQKIGLPPDYFEIWMSENVRVNSEDELILKLDYSDSTYMPKVSVSSDEVKIFLTNGHEQYEIRRFNPQKDSIADMCDQALFILFEFNNCMKYEDIPLDIDQNGQLVNYLTRIVEEEYSGLQQ